MGRLFTSGIMKQLLFLFVHCVLGRMGRTVDQRITQILDGIAEEFVPTCRHCKKTEDEHSLGKCLFDSSFWDPMNESEWAKWRNSLCGKLSAVDSEHLRDIISLDDPLNIFAHLFPWKGKGDQ